MRKLEVYIEEDGDFVLAGQIQGETWEDARFIYEKSYLENQSHQPISISLPFQEDAFSPFETRCYFEGLLPEGYTRRCVAGWMHVAEEDYLSVLAGLGNECLGAVRICEPGAGGCSPSYKKISREELLEFAKEGASKSAQFLAKAHLSLTGASGKTGLYYDNKDGWYMPFGTAPSTHIVKQSHVRLSGIVANEQLCLRTAKILGIDVPESFIISVGTGEHILFATKRFDRLMQEDSRVIDGKKVPFRLQQEDFAQALGVPASQKYEKIGGSYLKRVFTLLRQYSDNPVEDQLKLELNQRIIAGNAQFTGIAAGRGVGFTTGLLLLRKGLGMRETPIRPHSWHCRMQSGYQYGGNRKRPPVWRRHRGSLRPRGRNLGGVEGMTGGCGSGCDPAIHTRRLRVYHRPRRLRMASRISIFFAARRFEPLNSMG